MEAPAKAWAGTHQQAKFTVDHTDEVQVHPLLRDSGDLGTDDDRPSDIRLKAATPIDTSSLDAPDAELAPILDQLRRSLENMQGNHMQVEGIGQAMTDAHTALDDVLFRHATAQQYTAL